MSDNGNVDDTTQTSGAANFDDFSMYFVRFLILAVWLVYAMPIFEKLFMGKSLKWTSKLKAGWDYISPGKAASERLAIDKPQ